VFSAISLSFGFFCLAKNFPVGIIKKNMGYRYLLALVIEIIGIAALIAGLVLTRRQSIGTTLTLAGAALIAIGSLLFFKIFRI